jgi:hypothetical protein
MIVRHRVRDSVLSGPRTIRRGVADGECVGETQGMRLEGVALAARAVQPPLAGASRRLLQPADDRPFFSVYAKIFLIATAVLAKISCYFNMLCGIW